MPGRIILALCFVAGIAALAATLLPFATTNADGVDLRCGPAVFEVLMPADPAFDDIAENAGCPAPARTRLLISAAVVAGALVVAAVTERRTRRGSIQRDTRWLSSSSATRRSLARPSADAAKKATKKVTRKAPGTTPTAEVGPPRDGRSLPPTRS